MKFLTPRMKLLPIHLSILLLPMMILISNFADIYTIIYTAFALMLAAVPALIMGLRKGRCVASSRKALASIISGVIWVLTSNSFIVFQIERFQKLADYEMLAFYYNVFYLNAIIPAGVAAVVYWLVPRQQLFAGRQTSLIGLPLNLRKVS